MGNVRVIAATARESAEGYRDAVEQVFRQFRVPPGALIEVRWKGNQMLGDVAFAVHREQVARLALMDVTKIRNIQDHCRRAQIDPATFDPPLDAA